MTPVVAPGCSACTATWWTPTPGSGAMERGGVGVRKSADSNSARSPLERGPITSVAPGIGHHPGPCP
ncbi:hypothetical protein HaLaN_31824, partial [Haematococcus lacustris]